MEDTVAFTVTLDGDYSPVTGEKIPYRTVITNIGGGYHTQRNEFVSPQAGAYVFYAAILALDGSACRLDFFKNVELIGGRVYSDQDQATNQGFNMVLLELQEADTVSMIAANGCVIHGGDNYSTFSGFKIN